MSKKKTRKLHGTVQKIIQPIHPSEPEKAQIAVDEADELYRELRVENTVADEDGEKARLKPDAKVDVIIEAEPEATTPKGTERPSRPGHAHNQIST
jgi:hypothetical protein